MKNSPTVIISQVGALVLAMTGFALIVWLLTTRVHAPPTWNSFVLALVPMFAAQGLLSVVRRRNRRSLGLSQCIPLLERGRKFAALGNNVIFGIAGVVVVLLIFSFLALSFAVKLFGFEPGITEQDVGTVFWLSWQAALGVFYISAALQACYGADFE